MAILSAYLAKSYHAKTQRAHFGLFIPNENNNNETLSKSFRTVSCTGTIIHVTGEPVMAGYILEFKRNCQCNATEDLQELILLGHIDSKYTYSPSNTSFSREYTPRSVLEREATMISTPRRGQDPRALVDGVCITPILAAIRTIMTSLQINTKRCQEWTMEYLEHLVGKGLIGADAVGIAQSHRDPPGHGIFGHKGAGRD